VRVVLVLMDVDSSYHQCVGVRCEMGNVSCVSIISTWDV
jgi:hypothetical protein